MRSVERKTRSFLLRIPKLKESSGPLLMMLVTRRPLDQDIKDSCGVQMLGEVIDEQG